MTLQPAPPLTGQALTGAWVSLRPVDPQGDLEDLYRAGHDPRVPDLWKYLSNGPFGEPQQMATWLASGQRDPMFQAVVPAETGQPEGMAAYMRIKPEWATVEIGHIWFGAGLRQTRAATEAIFLLIDHAVDQGYRRVEWKCNAENKASRRAALRFGFSFEGIFHQHMIVRGANRDSAWYALLDHQWPAMRAGYLGWLAADNFHADGRQRRPLAAFMGAESHA